MPSAKQTTNTILRTVASMGLVCALGAGFSLACVKSSNNSGTGGTTSSGGTAGTITGAGGTTSSGGTTTVLQSCADAGITVAGTVVTGNACTPNPMLFTIQDNTAGTGATGTSCPIALWANDGTSSGYFFLPWCNTAGGTDCTLSMACTGGSIQVTGSYKGASTTGIDGNGGFGLNLQTTYPDAGPGCQMISGTGLTGVTISITNSVIPSNQVIIGINLANGNAAEYTATLTTGLNQLQIPFGSFKRKANCGGIPDAGVVSMYFVFPWFGDAASHDVNATFGNVGFY